MSSRPTARPLRSSPDKGVSLSALVMLFLLLLLPGYAGSRLASSIDWRLLAILPLVVSVFSFFAYRSDKKRAEAGAWRIPESTLHILEFIGGWPGAFLAQRQFRHKISKLSYQVTFWAIVLIYQLVAMDCLVGWQFTKGVLRLIRA